MSDTAGSQLGLMTLMPMAGILCIHTHTHTHTPQCVAVVSRGKPSPNLSQLGPLSSGCLSLRIKPNTHTHTHTHRERAGRERAIYWPTLARTLCYTYTHTHSHTWKIAST